MYKYQISRVLEVFDGVSFQGIIDLGMGVYLKKKIILSGLISPSVDKDSDEYEYGMQARSKLEYFLRNCLREVMTVQVTEYHDECVWGSVNTEELDQKYGYDINYVMYMKGYVWDNGLVLDRDDNKKRHTYVLNTPYSKYYRLQENK